MANVLVVDDDPVVRRMAAALIARSGENEVRLAGGGAEALALVEQQTPDLVITDLNMPEIGGLELLKCLRDKHEGLPVIVMTAHGDEQLPVKVLKAGAASYLPKSLLDEGLLALVTDVLAISQSERRNQRVNDFITQTSTEYLLENDPELITPLVGHLQAMISRMQLRGAEGRLQVGIALMEALSNAMFHGNLELDSSLRQHDAAEYLKAAHQRREQDPYRSRRVYVCATATHEQAVFTIRDQGPGFEVTQVADPTSPEKLTVASGRGLLLIRTFMDEVRHNAAGNEITMMVRKR